MTPGHWYDLRVRNDERRTEERDRRKDEIRHDYNVSNGEEKNIIRSIIMKQVYMHISQVLVTIRKYPQAAIRCNILTWHIIRGCE